LINLIGFNLSWFGLVYWGNAFIPISVSLLLMHLYFYGRKNHELLLILIITLIGVIVDSLLQHLNVFVFEYSTHIPLWLITLWACFASTISHSLDFLSRHKALQVLVGGLLAPLSYLAGYKLNAVDITFSISTTYLILSLIWGVLFICFYAIKDTLANNEVSHA
jgi:pheromone shutdown protein TraB